MHACRSLYGAFCTGSRLSRRYFDVSRPSTSFRHASAWMNTAKADADTTLSKDANVERLFTDPQIQELLHKLTGMELENKVFRPRRTSLQARSHYALMTDERLEKTIERMQDEARLFLQFVPLKEPRTQEIEILSKDQEIAGFDTSKFVFTDITFDATDQDRTVVVREIDGTLRTANPEEHDRMNRVYYNKPNRPVVEPSLFSDPWLQNALDRSEHEFVLDWACWYFEPDDPSFVKLSKTVFDRIIETENFEVLHSTRHFGSFVFYLALNGNLPPLLNFFGGRGMLSECAWLVRLQKTVHPDWRVAVGSNDSDLKIVQDYIRQNARFKPQLSDLLAFLHDGTIKVDKETKSNERDSEEQATRLGSRKAATVNASNVSRTDGPLGDLSSEYSVRVDVSDSAAEPTSDSEKPKGRPQFKGRRGPKKGN